MDRPEVVVACRDCGGRLKVNHLGNKIRHVTEPADHHDPTPLAITPRGVSVIEMRPL